MRRALSWPGVRPPASRVARTGPRWSGRGWPPAWFTWGAVAGIAGTVTRPSWLTVLVLLFVTTVQAFGGYTSGLLAPGRVGQLLGGGGPVTPLTIFGANLSAWYDPTREVFTDAAADLDAAASESFAKTSPTFAVTNKMTIRLTYKPRSIGVAQTLVSRWAYATDGQFSLVMNAAGSLTFYVAATANDPGNNAVTTTEGLTAGVTYQITIVYDGTLSAANRVAIYINGVAATPNVAGTIPATMMVTSTPLRVGIFDGIGWWGDGLLYLVGFSTQALSGAALTAAHTATSYGSMTTARKADWFSFFPLCESTGFRKDQGGAGNHLTGVNAPGVAAGALEIDVSTVTGESITNAPVKRRGNQSGAVDAIQTGITNQYLYILDADGSGNPGFDHDGVDDVAIVADTFPQPFTIAGHARIDANNGAMWGGDAVNEWLGRGTDVYEIQMGGTARTGGTAAGAWARVIAVFNGAASKVYINGVETITGDPGSAAVTIDWVIGTKSNVTFPMDGRTRHLMQVDGAASLAQVTALDAWMVAN